MNLNNGDSVPPSALEGASPDLSQRKMNAKVGVTLAPLHQQPVVGQGRTSMMSIKGLEEEQVSGTESHPILRV